MALGDLYASLAELKARVDITDTDDDDALTQALEASSRQVEQWCRRQFNQAGTASARMFVPTSPRLALVADFHTTTGLTVETDEGADGSFDQTWTAGDYQLEPLGGVQDGIPGWPYWRIRAVDSLKFSDPKHGRATVRVTADWGWAAVPEPIQESTLLLAAETYKLRESPFGIAGEGDYGVIRVRDNHKAMRLLAPFRRDVVRTAV